MKIMYLLFSFTIGGAERLVTNICNELVKNHEIHLYIVNELYSPELINCLDKRIRVKFAHREGHGHRLKSIFDVTRYICDNQIEVVHCNSLNSPDLLVLKSLFFKDVRVVQTVHNMHYFQNMPLWRLKIRNTVCQQYIAISDSVKADVIGVGIEATKVTTIYNAINLDEFISVRDRKGKNICKNICKTEKTEATNFEKYKLVPVRIGVLARIDLAQKGQDLLLYALDMLNVQCPIECYIGGEADSNHKKDWDELIEIADKLQSENSNIKIFFLGKIIDVPKFLNSLDIFVMPSRFEGFGISLIEAMAMGIPCIACNIDGPAEILGNNQRGLTFETGNVQDLAAKITQMMRGDYIKYIDNDQYLYDNYSMTEMCKKLLEVYQHVE